jgi:hypothetical protein
MKRSHTIKIKDLQNSISEGSIEEISQEQIQKISGGGINVHEAPPYPPKDKHPDYVECPPYPRDEH